MTITVRTKCQTKHISQISKLMIVLATLLLAACTSKVTVVGEVPRPLVEKVPLNVRLAYSEEFKNQVYTENEKRRALSSLNFADAQIQMFDTVFSGIANLVPADSSGHDVLVEPEVLDFQYTAPSETKLKQYEVWIKYRLKLTDASDAKLADWTIKGYGKTPTALLTSASKAFNSAANIALRDVGAQLATRFGGQRKIKELVASKTNALSEPEQTAAASQAQIEESDKPASAGSDEVNDNE